MNYQFPRTRFVDGNGLASQLDHVLSEVFEAIESSHTPNLFHTVEEIVDAYHSLETLLRILEEDYKVDLELAFNKVHHKNKHRGYYT